MGKQWEQWETYFPGLQNHCRWWLSHETKRPLLFGRKTITNLDSIWKGRDVTLPTKVCLVKAMVFFSSHVWMWELDHIEGLTPKNWCLWTVTLEKTLETSLDCKEIKPVYPRGNQSWIFTGRTDALAEAPIRWPPDAKSQLIRKDPDGGRDRRQEKGMTVDEMVSGITDSMDMSLSELSETVDRED